jgi:hypothetical protein
VAVLVTVIVPFLVVVPPVLSAGVGALIVIVAAVSVKLSLVGELVPFVASEIETA